MTTPRSMENAGLEGKALLDEAAQHGEQYAATCGACAPAAFAAVMDTLGYAEDPVMRELYAASIGLTGGVGLTSVGTCGAITGAAMAISFSFGLHREDIESNPTKAFAVSAAVGELARRVEAAYGDIECQEIQFALWGKSFRFTNADALAEFVTFIRDERSGFKCNKLTGAVSAWAVELILKHNPSFCRRTKA